jgi:hypothetical protein
MSSCSECSTSAVIPQRSEEYIQVLPNNWGGSAYLDSRFNSYSEVALYIKYMLGYPQSTVEMSNSQIAMCIDEALDIFTKHSSHYTTEYIALWPNWYKKNCGFDLTQIPEFCGNSQQCITYTTQSSIVTSIEIEKNNLGTGFAYISAKGFNPFDFCYGDETDTKNPNNPNNPNYDPRNPVDISKNPKGNDIILSFDKNNPWNFDICDANSINIIPLSSENVPATTIAQTSAYLVLKNGKGYLYKDKSFFDPCPNNCIPLSSWWNFNLNTATHIEFPDLPNFCLNQTLYPLQHHEYSSKVPMFTVCNSAMDSGGELLTNVRFVSSCHVIPSLTGTHYSNEFLNIISSENVISGSDIFNDIKNNITNDWKNTGLGIDFELNYCIPETPCKRKYEVSFDKVTVTKNYGTVSTEVSGTIFDHDLQNRRKVRSISKVEPNSYGGFGGLNAYIGGIFGVEYVIMNQVFGFNAMGGRTGGGSVAYNLFDHSLMMSLLETMKYQLTYVQYEFNPKTQFLRVFPEPFSSFNSNKGYVARMHVTQPIKNLINEPWVRAYSLALSKIILGRIRSKYSGVNLPNGITIQGTELITEGNAERDALFTQLVSQTGADKRPPLAFMSL